jgi:hypothetical protein
MSALPSEDRRTFASDLERKCILKRLLLEINHFHPER